MGYRKLWTGTERSGRRVVTIHTPGDLRVEAKWSQVGDESQLHTGPLANGYTENFGVWNSTVSRTHLPAELVWLCHEPTSLTMLPRASRRQRI